MPAAPFSPTRRGVLAAALAPALALGVGGCGVRLEDDAPDLPLVPQRTPLPGEAPLLALLGALSSRVATADEQRRDPLRAQRDALRSVLDHGGVPHADLERAAGSGPVEAGSEISAYEGSLREADPDLLPLLAALAVSRRTEPGVKASWWREPEPVAWRTPADAAPALAATRAARWALTVVVAKGGEPLRERSRGTLEVLERLAVRQSSAADDDGATSPLGYTLEQEVTSASAARELARTTLTRLVDDYAAVLPALADDRAAVLEVVAWTTRVQREAVRWELPWVPFPGLDEPGTS